MQVKIDDLAEADEERHKVEKLKAEEERKAADVREAEEERLLAEKLKAKENRKAAEVGNAEEKRLKLQIEAMKAEQERIVAEAASCAPSDPSPDPGRSEPSLAAYTTHTRDIRIHF